MRQVVGVILVGLVPLLPGCAQEASFPNQIPDIVQSLSVFHTALSDRNRAAFDSVCTDRELYDALVAVWQSDSLAVLTRRIHNPIDSAHVIMTVARYVRESGRVADRYQLELFMRREDGRYCIVAHRLTPSPP